MLPQERNEIANEVAKKSEASYGSFWKIKVWTHGEVVRIYIDSGKKRCGHIDVSKNGLKPQMATLRDTNRINEVL